MAWLAVDKDGIETIYMSEPNRFDKYWDDCCPSIKLPKGSIKKLIGRELSWEDKPVELKEE